VGVRQAFGAGPFFLAPAGRALRPLAQRGVVGVAFGFGSEGKSGLVSALKSFSKTFNFV
jgi:hypothetical protein